MYLDTFDLEHLKFRSDADSLERVRLSFAARRLPCRGWEELRGLETMEIFRWDAGVHGPSRTAPIRNRVRLLLLLPCPRRAVNNFCMNENVHHLQLRLIAFLKMDQRQSYGHMDYEWQNQSGPLGPEHLASPFAAVGSKTSRRPGDNSLNSTFIQPLIIREATVNHNIRFFWHICISRKDWRGRVPPPSSQPPTLPQGRTLSEEGQLVRQVDLQYSSIHHS